jgi:MFS family permease
MSNHQEIPYGVRVITAATSVRWFGWGLAESLIPVVIFSLAHTYAMAGLVGSSYDFAFIMTLPLAGLAADGLSATSLVALSLALYPLVGLAYLLSGAFGLLAFVVIARVVNGMTYALDYVGRETYIRRHVKQRKLATVFGYFDTVADLWWIVAALMGIALINYFSIPFLLFMIAPTSAIALVMVLRLRRMEREIIPRLPVASLRGSYFAAIKEIRGWSGNLKGLAFFNFVIAMAGTVTAFFLPIEAHVEGASLAQVILIGVLFAIPPLLGWFLGNWFDLKGTSLFPFCLLALAVLVGSIGLINTYDWKLFAAFGVGMILELLTLGTAELVTRYTLPDHFGRVGAIVESICDLGSLIGPLAIGVLIDLEGASRAFESLGAAIGVLASIVWIVVRHGSTHVRFGGDSPSPLKMPNDCNVRS